MHGSTRFASNLTLEVASGAIRVAGGTDVIGRLLGRWLGG